MGFKGPAHHCLGFLGCATKKGDWFIEDQRDMMGNFEYIYIHIHTFMLDIYGYIITDSMEYGFVQTWWIPDFLPLN